MKTVTLPIEIPAHLIKQGIDQQYIQNAVIVLLYGQEMLTSKSACDTLKISRREFEETILPQFECTTYGNTPEDIEADLNFPQNFR